MTAYAGRTEFRIRVPDRDAATELRPYMEAVGEAHRLAYEVYPRLIKIPVPTVDAAVAFYPHMHRYGSRGQLLWLEGDIKATGHPLPIPSLTLESSVEELVGIDRRIFKAFTKMGIRTLGDLTSRRTGDLPHIPGIGTGKRKRDLIRLVHAHGFKFEDERE